jgi:hypothetical protein
MKSIRGIEESLIDATNLNNILKEHYRRKSDFDGA